MNVLTYRNILAVIMVLAMFLAGGAFFVLPALAATPDGAIGPWADSVVTSTQGTQKNGSPVVAARSDETAALGEAETGGTPYDSGFSESDFFSLGFGGTITLSFDNSVVNGAGPDFQMYEVTGGNNYPDEKIKVEASHNGTDWVVLEESVTRDAEVDLGILSCAQYVRITDVSDPSLFNGSADGYDLDGVIALHTSEEGCSLSAGVEIVKLASSPEVAPGEEVTYTYTVTNTGDFDLDNVVVTDDKCSPVGFTGGDIDDDSVLDLDETWTYECTQTLNETTENIGTVTADDPFDNEVSDSDTISVAVAASGCTLTQGYWKTHNADEEFNKSNAPEDETWDSLEDDVSNFVNSDMSWYEVFWTPTKGRVWYQLAHQYMAALLNIENGASVPGDVQTALDGAEEWFSENTDPNEKLKGSDATKARDLASTLASFNEGEIGPGHCGDDEDDE